MNVSKPVRQTSRAQGTEIQNAKLKTRERELGARDAVRKGDGANKKLKKENPNKKKIPS